VPSVARRILIVDDHDRIRVRVRAMLAEIWPQAIFAEASTASTGSRLAIAEVWDLVIVDLRLADGSGLSVVRNLAAGRPTIPVIVLSALPRDPYEAAALEAGALAFIPKQDAAEQLAATARALVENT